MADLPTGTVTFLFTDLEGSTRLGEEHPDAMPAALVRHDEILRSAIESHGGVVFSEMGDGMAAAFASAAGAVSAALAAQIAMRDESWNEIGGMRARMGLHTGEGVLRADGHYVNHPLNRCARLMAVAHGGQVLLSDTVEVLVRGGLGPEVTFADLGEHRLRDLAQPVHVFQVCAAGLTPAFPRLRSLDTYPGNLPVQLTSFVGREAELAGIAKALDEWRLVTLTVPAVWARHAWPRRSRPTYCPRFLTARGCANSRSHWMTRRWRKSWRPPWGYRSARACRWRRASATISAPRHSCWCSTTASISLVRPARSQRLSCASVRASESSRRAARVSRRAANTCGRCVRCRCPPRRALRRTLRPLMRCSCSRTGRRRRARPLCWTRPTRVPSPPSADGWTEFQAIELAAARVVSLSPLEISALLDERFRLLTGGRRSAVERHQTLRATVDWSYSLLGGRDRVVFDRLGVFAGSFDARAAQAIVAGGGVDGWDVLDALGELAAKSMVVAEETADGTSRYQTLAQYARERLDEGGDVDEWRRRHAQYFAAWAEEAGPGLVGPDELAWRVRESVELDNLRAAVTWALNRDDSDDIGVALHIIGSLAAESQTNTTAGVGAWADWALPYAEHGPPPIRYAVIAAAAWYQFDSGHYEQAQALARRALDGGVPAGSPAADKADLALGVTAMMIGAPSDALAIQRASARRLDLDFPGTAAAAHAHAVAALAAQMADDPSARGEAESGIRIARESANPTAVVISHLALGQAIAADDPAGALVAFDEALTWSRRGASPVMHGTVLCFAAVVRARTGDFADAARDLCEGIERTHQDGSRTLFYVGVWSGVAVLTGVGRDAEAAALDGIASSGLVGSYRSAPGFSHIQEARARSRAALGAERYDHEFEAGASMTYEHAVEHILAVLHDLVDG